MTDRYFKANETAPFFAATLKDIKNWECREAAYAMTAERFGLPKGPNAVVCVDEQKLEVFLKAGVLPKEITDQMEDLKTGAFHEDSKINQFWRRACIKCGVNETALAEGETDLSHFMYARGDRLHGRIVSDDAILFALEDCSESWEFPTGVVEISREEYEAVKAEKDAEDAKHQKVHAVLYKFL